MATRKKVRKRVARKAVKRLVRRKPKRGKPRIKLRSKPIRKARKLVKAARKPVAKRAAKPIRPVRRKPSRKALKLLENLHVRNMFTEIAGEKALKIAGELTEPLSDEDLSAASKIKISEVRAVMNKLHSFGVAEYSRTRSDEGWYTYTWKLCLDRAQKIISERSAQRKGAAGLRDGAVTDYYACPNCSERSGRKFCFENAVEIEFRCPDCSEMLKYVEKKG